MSAALIDGEAIGQRIRDEVKAATARLEQTKGAAPELAVVLVGEDPASQIYVRAKVKNTQDAGMRSHAHRLPADATEEEVIALVARLSADPQIDGVLVQLPLPKHIDEARVLAALDPAKDVDGLTEASAGRLLLGKPGLRPCTPAGCVILARTVTRDLAGAHCVVIGRSILVGKPAALLFLEQNCTIAIAHSRTRDLPALCRSADILVAAVGRPEMIRGAWVKPGAIVIDVGINRVPAPELGPGKDGAPKSRIVGDVAFAEAREIAGAITPVPRGVGPMTRACLLRNTLLAACARRGWPVPPGFEG
ncbi:MAG: bifunctional methylenetetrahydrofolate dehydrogenase/methenyltetrahydrofolate cyclohydrolase FolD [Hydrogenophilaceae bacterium]|jgi:methylenetetrahydrofolate dehydrogenase (NADP+)/methenyltetrahydrofolate cyclohydrolase|nr:bifunctional methylenetetrahydrofolate dehydrogenase/methenyltetrahydrofolate cyclohydrolase FolD [Hydrogenophilaceae bacterium]